MRSQGIGRCVCRRACGTSPASTAHRRHRGLYHRQRNQSTAFAPSILKRENSSTRQERITLCCCCCCGSYCCSCSCCCCCCVRCHCCRCCVCYTYINCLPRTCHCMIHTSVSVRRRRADRPSEGQPRGVERRGPQVFPPVHWDHRRYPLH